MTMLELVLILCIAVLVSAYFTGSPDDSRPPQFAKRMSVSYWQLGDYSIHAVNRSCYRVRNMKTREPAGDYPSLHSAEKALRDANLV